MMNCSDKQIAFKRCQDNWGGATFDVTKGEFVESDADLYSFAISDTVSIGDRALFADFSDAVDRAIREYGILDVRYVGFFHDNAKGTIDINAVMVVDSQSKVDEAYDMGIEMPGGAYHFATGNGYWPQGRPEEYK